MGWESEQGDVLPTGKFRKKCPEEMGGTYTLLIQNSFTWQLTPPMSRKE